ncbi:MAG: hypothetical protein KF764_16165 [Labilithrix sp.]|nr:hypothetical protein [Labilithrix sp.]
MSIDVRASGSDLELWHVQLGGVVRTMSLDELDAAFQAGIVDERTMVLKGGALHWTTLGDVAGIDEQPNSIAPTAADIAPSSLAIPRLPDFDVSLTPGALDTAELATFRPKRRLGRAFGALAAVALVGGALFGVKSYGVDALGAKVASVTSFVKAKSVENAESARTAAVAPVAAEPVAVPVAETPSLPPPAPVESLPSATPSSAGVSIDSLPSASAKPGKADKKGKRSAEPAPRRKSGKKAKSKGSSDPTQRGSGQFDPLDGKL